MSTKATQLPNGQFTMKIGGKERTGKLDMEGICTVEAELGNISLMAAMADKKMWGFNVTCTVLWAALSRENPKITKKHVQTWVQNGLDEGAPLSDFLQAAQSAVLCSLGSQVREGTQKLTANPDALPNVDDEEEDGKRPLAKGVKKNLHTA